MPTLFSYVVDHDYGFAPNPEAGYCTLVHCKFQGRTKRRNIVESAKKGDWIIGTGGSSVHSSGHGSIIYFMRVDEILPFNEYLSDKRFSKRVDSIDTGEGNRFALISETYFYFGKNALKVIDLPTRFSQGLEKRGPSYRRDYAGDNLGLLIEWLNETHVLGKHGEPCSPKAEEFISTVVHPLLKRKSQRKAKCAR